jgi:hypothetical protein
MSKTDVFPLFLNFLIMLWKHGGPTELRRQQARDQILDINRTPAISGDIRSR